MFNAFLTDRNAQDIANIIYLFFAERDGRSFFKLEVSRQRESKELWVRPHLSELPMKLENGDEIVRCESSDGRQVDIVIPLREREYQPASVIIDTRPGARS